MVGVPVSFSYFKAVVEVLTEHRREVQSDITLDSSPPDMFNNSGYLSTIESGTSGACGES